MCIVTVMARKLAPRAIVTGSTCTRESRIVPGYCGSIETRSVFQNGVLLSSL